MKLKLLTPMYFCVIALSQIGCGQSPILNHVDAAPPKVLEAQAEKKSLCPMLFAKEKFCASISWVKKPTETEDGQFTLHLWNQEQASDQRPFSDPGHTVFVKLWMPSMGHGSSPTITTQSKDSGGLLIPGVFDVTDVYFVMPGAWQIMVQLKQNGQIIDQAIQDIVI